MGGFQRQPVSVRSSKAPERSAVPRPGSRVHSISVAQRDPISSVPSRTGFDFRSIRIFPNSANATVSQPDILAATLGGQVHLSPALSALPPESRRRVLAHELAHVAQQHIDDGAAADEAALDREADREADNLLAGRPFAVRLHASAAVPHFKRVKSGRKTYEVGDVIMNSAAQTDVYDNGNLMPDTDNTHLFPGGKNLGYDIDYKDPQDPFRWNQIKSIVDNEHININGVGTADQFKASHVEPPDPPKTVTLTLIQLQAGGITLPTLSRAQAIQPGKSIYTGSIDPARDEIYYESGKGGKKSHDKSSLAHELFGHFGLARQGAAWEHGATVAASPQISDPFGQPFVGKVDDYIEGFAQDRMDIFTSPTVFVSPAFLKQYLKELADNRGKGLTRAADGSTTASAAWRTIWLRLSQNYRALGVNPQPAPPAQQTGSGAPPAPAASPVPTRSDIEAAVLSWFGALNADQQEAFRKYVNGALLRLPLEPTELGSAVLNQLPKATP
jgi:hypothetical protein